jgi:hypothetical protein
MHRNTTKHSKTYNKFSKRDKLKRGSAANRAKPSVSSVPKADPRVAVAERSQVAETRP